METEYRNDLRPDAAIIAALYDSAALVRPTKNVDRIRRMYESSNVVWTAWRGDRLIGILRGWTDGAYDGYICDLAIDADYQKQGIGRELLARVSGQYGPEVQWILRASKIAAQYYEHIGWKRVENGWFLARAEWNKP